MRRLLAAVLTPISTQWVVRMGSESTSLRCLYALILTLAAATSGAHAATLADGDVLVANQGTGDIRQYSALGADLGSFASGFVLPSWITADSAGNVYVSEYGAGKIHKLSPEGVNLLTIVTPFTPGGMRVTGDGTIYVAAYGDGVERGIYRYTPSGVALGLFARPSGISGDFIEFDADENLYAPNFATGAIVRASLAGGDLGTFVTLAGAEGIAFDSGGNLYVSSYWTSIIKRYSTVGADLGTFASLGAGTSAYGLAFDRDGNLYVADYDGGVVRKFSPSGLDVGVFASGMAGPRDVLVFREPAPPAPAYTFVGFLQPVENPRR